MHSVSPSSRSLRTTVNETFRCFDYIQVTSGLEVSFIVGCDFFFFSDVENNGVVERGRS